MTGAREIRAGEVQLDFDPGERAEAGVTFIGHIRSDWRRGNCPRNLTQSREQGGGNARIKLRPEYIAGLAGLETGRRIWVLYWMDQGRRDLIQQMPKHLTEPRGVFTLRSPVRPNPIAMAAVRITSVDFEAGVIGIDATDAFDGTPVIDIKPWIEGVDLLPAG